MPAPLAALDVSASWTRGGADAWAAARDSAGRLGGTPLLVGDSLRDGAAPETPGDAASTVRPAVDRALAAGRALVLVTDGAVDDPDALDRLPAGSRVVVLPPAATPDLAVAAAEAPRAAVGGDTIDVRVRVAAGGGGAPAGELRASIEGGPAVAVPLDSLPAYGERTVGVRLPLPRREGSALLRTVVAAPGDAEPRNDTLVAVVELSEAAGVTVVSTAPDLDLRYMLEVLRGTVALPTRAYLRVAPGRWRAEGSLAPVEEATVRSAAARAPILVLHGDTTFLGRSPGERALLLMPTIADGEPEWYPVAAPPSPLAGGLSATPWDSLAPVVVGGSAPAGEWTGLVVQRGRRFERRAAIAGREQPRRRATVGVAGLWRWRARGGVGADAFAALWGGTFDWLAAEARDARAVAPEVASLREGEPVRWRRGTPDSVAQVVLRRRGAADSQVVALRFAAGAATATSAPLAAGIYDVALPGGDAVVAVNASRELVPRRPTVSDGPVGSGPAAAGVAPSLRGQAWAFVLVVLLLCAEWLVRRRAGLR